VPTSTPSPDGPPDRSIDRRLAARVRTTRRYLVVATGAGLASAATVVVQAALLATIISGVVLHRDDARQLAPQLIGLGAAFAARAALAWIAEVAAHRTSATVTSELRRALLQQTLRLGPVWLASERTGELSVTATRGIQALDGYFGRYLPQALLAATVPVLILGWVAAVDWPSFLVLLALLSLIPWSMAHFGRRAGREMRRQWRTLSSLAGRYLELVQGLPTLRAFGQSARGRREVGAATEALRRSTVSTLRVAFLSALVLDMLAGLGVGLVAMVLGLRLLDGTVPLSTALAVLLVSPEVFFPLRRAAAEFHASAEGRAAAARILDVLDTPTAAGDSAPQGALPAVSIPGARPTPDARQGADAGQSAVPGLRLAGVRARYPGSVTPVLEGFDLELRPGDHVALQGASGAGKSTVFAVLLGFLPCEEGEVTWAGERLHPSDLARWRAGISWVPQRPYVVRGTLEHNLRLGAPGAGVAAVDRTVEQVGLSRVVERLPDGLGTQVGEGGLGLSTGERQRLALGRAMLRDAPLVLLDEPLSHLDADDVEDLRPSVEEWIDGKTVLMAAHHDDVLPRADRTVVLRPPPRGSDPAVAAIGGGSEP